MGYIWDIYIYGYNQVGGFKSGWWCNNHLEKYESQWEGFLHILWTITVA